MESPTCDTLQAILRPKWLMKIIYSGTVLKAVL